MSQAATPTVQVANLHKFYGDVHALRGLDLEVGSGQVLGFLGPNGAGKTTAIKILSGFLTADEGSAKICGLDCLEDSLEVKKILGYLPENNPLYPDTRVIDALKFVARAHFLTGAKLRSAIERVVAQTQLSDVLYRQVGTCSKGFKQRIGLAQSLLNDPQVLLLDEPTNGLDPLQVIEMRNLISELGKQKTVIITSHVLSEVEAVAARVVMMNRGKKVSDKNLAAIGDVRLFEISAICGEAELISICSEAGAIIEEIRADETNHSCKATIKSESSEDVNLVARIANVVVARDIELLSLHPQANTLEQEFKAVCLSGGSL
ncbi:MAG: ATP-binding cassette domain-containing protein [Planctomycetota bacterium]|jgi:ABC-2 type transport system ATP-binding protein|nr:ATP-binding cassette domain-containing protein [Planctomycetota bacterium]